MIDSKDISVVVQGVIDPKITPLTINSIRYFFPGSEIVVGTYVGSDTTSLEYDKIAFCQDPGVFPYSSHSWTRPNNINRQIQTTLSGLKAATRKYAFKLRSDFILNGNNFLSFWDKFTMTDSDYRIFDHKILSCVFFARNPRWHKCSYAFHPSDIAFFGLHADLINLFDIPLMKKDESVYTDGLWCCRYVPEQYIWISCLCKNGHSIELSHHQEISGKIIEDTERYAVSNFIYLDWKQFNLTPPRHLFTLTENDFDNTITHIEWQRLYKHYLDKSLVVPDRDYLREFISRKNRVMKFYRLLARLAVIWLRTKFLREFRQKARAKITHYLVRNLSVPH
jgi:hypothetical protein